MFPCSVCEDSDYENVNGLYYCKTCGTLSQEHHEQEAAELDPTLFTSLRKVKQGKRITISRNLGRPWTIYECYQCIILAQCDALIDLGASRDLKDIVFTLWANYLSKLKIAFNKVEQVLPDIVLKSGFGRRRELYGGTLEKPCNRIRRIKRSCQASGLDRGLESSSSSKAAKRKKGSDASDSSFDGESSTMTEESQGNDRESDFDSDIPSDDSDEDSVAFVAKGRKKYEYQGVKKSLEWMDLKKTVVFCYLGLQISNPEILLVQLLRWICEGKVPFMSTSHLLNDDMVLSAEDQVLLYPCKLSIHSVAYEKDLMTDFLSLPSSVFPKAKLNHFIKEFVRRLHLPDELEIVCWKLHRKVHIISKSWRMEFIALQYIALSLKMIFGLDDSTENQLSEYSEEAQRVIGSGGNLFVWEEWRSYQVRKERTDFDLYRDFLEDRKYKYQDLDKILESCKHFQREDRRVCVLGEHLVEKHHKLKIEGLTDPIKMVIAGCTFKTESSFDSEDGDNNETLEQKFAGSTLAHIIEPDAFKTRFEENLGKRSWEVLKHQREKILEKLVYTTYSPDKGQFLPDKRSNSYFWLMHFLSNFVDCEAEHLDKALISLEGRIGRAARRK